MEREFGEGSRWIRKSAGVILKGEALRRVDLLSRAYFARTGHKIVVTSGTRTPTSQAGAMLSKLKLGDALAVYRDKRSVAEIIRALRVHGVVGGARVIAAQIKRGVLISRHLSERAFDVRSSGIDDAQFRKAAEAAKCRVIFEGVPAHYHLDF